MKTTIDNIINEGMLLANKVEIIKAIERKIRELDTSDTFIIFQPELKKDISEWVERLGFIFDGENSDDQSNALIKFK